MKRRFRVKQDYKFDEDDDDFVVTKDEEVYEYLGYSYGLEEPGDISITRIEGKTPSYCVPSTILEVIEGPDIFKCNICGIVNPYYQIHKDVCVMCHDKLGKEKCTGCL